jgi:hypothetical protein
LDPLGTPAMPPRFTIARLLALVGFCGIAFASLRSPSQLWASTMFALALGSIPVALLNAIYGRGGRRAFWVGFCVVGTAYFTASLGPWFREEFGPRMVTTALLDMVYPQMAPTPAAPAVSAAINPTAPAALGRALSLDLSRAVAAGDRDLGAAAALALLYNGSLPPTPTRWAAWTEVDRSDGVGYQIGRFSLVSTAPFRRIGHSLLTLVLAGLGGVYARRRYIAHIEGAS